MKCANIIMVNKDLQIKAEQVQTVYIILFEKNIRN